jgi:hypothetical protein
VKKIDAPNSIASFPQMSHAGQSIVKGAPPPGNAAVPSGDCNSDDVNFGAIRTGCRRARRLPPRTFVARVGVAAAPVIPRAKRDQDQDIESNGFSFKITAKNSERRNSDGRRVRRDPKIVDRLRVP